MHRARPPLLPRALPLCRAPACSTALPHAVPARDPLHTCFLSLLAPLRAKATSAMPRPAELLCRRCSLSYNPPAPTQSSPSEARGTVRPPSPLHRLFRPPERRRRLFRLARATGHCGQAATSHLRPCRGLPWARASPVQPQHPSFAADEHRSGRNHELRRAPLLCSAREGEEDLAREEKQVQGVYCRTIDSNE